MGRAALALLYLVEVGPQETVTNRLFAAGPPELVVDPGDPLAWPFLKQQGHWEGDGLLPIRRPVLPLALPLPAPC